MKKCILVWQVPVIEGEPYNPVEYAVHVRKAKKFAEALNRYFAEKNMDYNCVLDKSACSLDEIFSLHDALPISIKKKCRMRS